MDELALELAYRYLARRDRTIAEMRSHLSGRGIDASAIETTIEILRDQRYLDDARFVRLFAQDKRQLEQWGSERIKRTLIDRGIDRDLLDAVDEGQAAGSELERALELLRARCPRPPRDRRDRDRALGLLLRRGYAVELAVEALAAFARERGHEPTSAPIPALDHPTWTNVGSGAQSGRSGVT